MIVNEKANKGSPMLKDLNIWERVTHAHDEGDGSMARYRFLAASTGEAITQELKIRIQGGTLQVADFIAGHLVEPVITSNSWDRLLIVGLFDDSPVLAEVYNQRREAWRLIQPEISPLTIVVTGRRRCGELLTKIKEQFKQESVAEIKWWYSDESSRASYKSIYLPPLRTRLLPEFYPDLGNPQDFLRKYLESDAAILLIAGPPGTGKTTMLRHLIQDHCLTTHITYDEVMMSRDQVFQSFLFDEDSDLLIIEDADTVLASREDENNRLMARFLNVSDGLIKFPNKKLVFTTNISDFGRVDSALIRPGRCYAVLHTRALNLTEAQAAAKVASLPIPTERHEYTLAELFNQSVAPRYVRRIGLAG